MPKTTDSRKKFSQIVIQFANSEELKREMASKIGDPKEGEAKDEYLFRAKRVLKNFFYKQFNIQEDEEQTG